MCKPPLFGNGLRTMGGHAYLTGMVQRVSCSGKSIPSLRESMSTRPASTDLANGGLGRGKFNKWGFKPEGRVGQHHALYRNPRQK